MKAKSIFRTAASLLLVFLMVFSLAACSGAKVTVTVNDMGTTTDIEASVGMKISDVLAEGKITLGEKDETEPAADAQLTEDVKEIVIKRYAKVTVVKGSDSKEVEMVGGTVEDAVKKAGFTLAEGDKTDADLKAYVKDGMTVTITEGKTGVKVSITVDGKTNEVVTTAETVGDLLKEQKIQVGEDDVMSEKADAPVKEGLQLTIKRVTFKEETRTETVDYETEERYSDSLSEGESEVTQEGVEGEKEVVYKVKYVDGKESGSEKLSEKVTKEPVNKVVTYGTKQQEQAQPQQSYVQPDPQPDPEPEQPAGKTVVNKVPVYNCDGSGHGYYEIYYSDGSVEYEEF